MLVLCALASACTGHDSSTVSDTATSETTMSTTSVSHSSTSTTTLSSSSTAANTQDTGSSSSSSGGLLDFPPVECGGDTCLEGQLCVQDGLDCDYSEMPPEWVMPPPFCADVPDPCPEAGPNELEDCLGEVFCTNYDASLGALFNEGALACPPVALDCF